MPDKPKEDHAPDTRKAVEESMKKSGADKMIAESIKKLFGTKK